MTPSQERKYLRSVLDQLQNGAPWALRSRWVEIALWLATVVILLALFQLGGRLHPYISFSVCVLLGVVLGAFLFWQVAAAQWPFLRPHVSRESVERRIAELEP